MHSIADEKRSAFSNRLRHLQKLGFPPGTNAGRGRAVAYQTGHAIQLAIVLEMNQVGLSPERAIRLSAQHDARIRSAVHWAATKMMSGDDEPILLFFDPVVLADLRGEEEWDETEATFDVSSQAEFRASIGDNTNLRSRRYALINVTAVLYELSHRLGELVGKSDLSIVGEFRICSDAGEWHDGST